MSPARRKLSPRAISSAISAGGKCDKAGDDGRATVAVGALAGFGVSVGFADFVVSAGFAGAVGLGVSTGCDAGVVAGGDAAGAGGGVGIAATTADAGGAFSTGFGAGGAIGTSTSARCGGFCGGSAGSGTATVAAVGAGFGAISAESWGGSVNGCRCSQEAPAPSATPAMTMMTDAMIQPPIRRLCAGRARGGTTAGTMGAGAADVVSGSGSATGLVGKTSNDSVGDDAGVSSDGTVSVAGSTGGGSSAMLRGSASGVCGDEPAAVMGAGVHVSSGVVAVAGSGSSPDCAGVAATAGSAGGASLPLSIALPDAASGVSKARLASSSA